MNKRGLLAEMRENWRLYFLIVPLVCWLILYAFLPLGGLAIAFQKFSPFKGIEGSPFIGFDNFERMMSGPQAYLFWRALGNTLLISLYGLVFGFPIPIMLALLFNEIKEGIYRKSIQTVSYLPHLISEVTIASIVLTLLQLNGPINIGIEKLLALFGADYSRIAWMSEPAYFQGIYVFTGIWKEAGFSSIVYFAALVSISPTLYEAAKIDGASRWQRIKYVSIPGILPTIVIMMIIRIGDILNVGYERVILLYNPSTYVTADVLSSWTFRLGSAPPVDYGLSTAGALFNSVIGFILVIAANRFAKKRSETSLW